MEVGYVPEDFLWAQWVQLLLDGRVVPEAEIMKATRLGFPRPSKVTVSLCELADADNLSEQQVGKWLVVIISKASADHKGLGTLLGRFRAAGGDERIVALVVDSDPGFTSPGDDCSTWLPRWLRWRYKAGRFTPAESSEPMIVDARGGVSTLDAIGRGMLSTVLDLDSGCLLQSLPTAPDPAAAKAASKRSGIDQSASTSKGRPELFVLEKPKKGGGGLKIAVIAGLVCLAGAGAYFGLSPKTATPAAAATQPASSLSSAKPTVTLRPAAANEAERIPALDAPAPVAAAPAPATTDAPPAVAEAPLLSPPSHTPAPAPEAMVVATAAPSIETSITPAPVSEEVVEEPPPPWLQWIVRGDRLADRRDFEPAMDAYRRAVLMMRSTAEASAPESPTAVTFAELCLKLSALQHNFASTAEATESLTLARRVLGGSAAAAKTKGKKSSKEAGGGHRADLLNQIQASLVRMGRDAATQKD